MASINEMYFINNLNERLYTIILYFKKGESITSFLEHLKTIIKENDLTFEQNIISFKSKEAYYVLKNKYNTIFEEIKNSNKFPCFLNFRLSFENFKNAITIFTIIQPYVKIDQFINDLKDNLNQSISEIDDNIKTTYNIKNKVYEFLSYALINNKKLLLTIDKELYTILNIIFSINKNMFNMNPKERRSKMTKDSFIYSYLFSFNFKQKEYLFKEFLNTCKVCKNYHQDIGYNKKKCYPICMPCGMVKENDHICKEKSLICGLCKLYHNKNLKHVPFGNECLHKKNIQTAMFIDTRQKTLLKIFSKKIKIIPREDENFLIDLNSFPVLKSKTIEKTQSCPNILES
jgi:hypothetical protein